MNRSKISDPRFWGRWVISGAVRLTGDQREVWSNAKEWLKYIRGHSANLNGIIYIGECVKAGMPLRLIGASHEELSYLCRRDCIAEATILLKEAREHGITGSIGEFIRGYMTMAGATLESIGTSEEELGQLLKNGYITNANHWLKVARKRAKKNCVVSEVELVREYTAKAGVALESIGTSEEELERLSVEVHITRAKYWLKVARERARKNCVDSEVGLVLEFTSKAGISLESTGTNEQELERLLSRGYFVRARSLLRDARRLVRKYDVSYVFARDVEVILKYTSKAGVTPESIGASEKELEQFLAGSLAG